MNLFDYAEKYPEAPGWKKTDTSRAAADDIKPKAGAIRQKVLAFLKEKGPHTSREIAEGIGIDYDSVQPRTSELRAQNLIEDSGIRAPDSKSGKMVIVWMVA